MANPASPEGDLRAIQDLNERHVQALMSSDMESVMSLWSDDFTILPPAGPIIRGRRSNEEIVRAGIPHMQAFEPVEYVEDLAEIKIGGDYAFEWGTYRGSSRPRGGGDSIRYGGKILRILQRQSDGSWRMYRTMTTTNPG
jgi:ketosteroid isomerase-like protein